jgi:hypothetical protein
MVSRGWASNQAAFGLSVAPQNRRREVGVGDMSRSSGLVCLEASRARVSQSGLKTGGGVTAGGARGIIVEITWSCSSRQTGRCDGLYRTHLPQDRSFHCIRPQGHSSLILFCLGLYIGPYEVGAPCHFSIFTLYFLV